MRAAYHFMPFARRAAAAAIEQPDGGGTLPPRIRLAAAVRVADGARVAADVTLFGPGDILGIEPRQIVRVSPPPGTTDAEPNYFPHLEFDEPTLPWLFTPARAEAGRLRPWCVLVVVRRQEGVELRPGDPLPVLEIAPPASPARELPDPAESWAWAHAQVITEDGRDAVAALDGDPRLSLARLTCPRRLDPQRSWLACLVPAFDAGVAVGLGQHAEAETLQPAWRSGAAAPASIRLPVYHSWEFATGPAGDFESLARRLAPRAAPEGLGLRRMFIGAAGANLPRIAPDVPGAVLGQEGALRAPGQSRAAIPQPTAGRIQTALRALIDANAGRGDQVLTAPLYGRYPTRRHTLPAPGALPRWLLELNLDPRERAAAGAGARIVRRHQEALVEEAWHQAGELRGANRRLGYLQLARAAAGSLHRRHLAKADEGTLLQLVGPAARRIRLTMRPLATELAASALPSAAVDPAFRKILRPRKAVTRFGLRLAESRGPVVADLNAGRIRPAPEWAGPDGAAGAAGTPRLRLDASGQRTALPDAGGITAPPRFAAAFRPLAGKDAPPSVDVAAVVAAELPASFKLVGERTALRGAVPAPSGRPAPAAAALPPALSTRFRDATLPSELGTGEALPEAQIRIRFRQALGDSLPRLILPPQVAERRPPLDLAGVRRGILAATEPGARALRRARARITGIDLAAPRRAVDPLGPVVAGPCFPVALATLLDECDPELLMPGLGLVPPDSVMLLEANPRFVEALLVGANHEMARELAWRGFPVNRRATLFQRFWERPPGAFDVPPIAGWSPAAELGGNAAAGAPAPLVLLIRAELLRRYPGTVIYATEATWQQGRRRPRAGGAERDPLFAAETRPDVALRGFALTLAEARGAARESDGPAGWYFVLESQPTEPRFGMDAATAAAAAIPGTWNDLSWGHVTGGRPLDELSHAPLGAFPPGTTRDGFTWGRDAAHMAAITFQAPARILIHARRLLAGPA